MCFYSPHQKKAQNHQANLNQNKTSPHCFGPAKERVSFPCGHCSKASSCLPESPAGSHNCSLPRSAPQVGFLLFKSPSVMPGARAGHRAQLGLKCHLQSHARAHIRTHTHTRLRPRARERVETHSTSYPPDKLLEEPARTHVLFPSPVHRPPASFMTLPAEKHTLPPGFC